MSRYKSAFSLLEVMIALAVMAIVFGGVASNMASMEQTRRLALNRQVMSDLAKSITHRLMTVEWSSVVDANRDDDTTSIHPWSAAKFDTVKDTDPTPPTFGEFSDQAGYTIDELIANGFMGEEHSFPVDGIEVFIEYYRQQGRSLVEDGITTDLPGLLDPDVDFDLADLHDCEFMWDYRVEDLLGLRYSRSLDSITTNELVEANYDPVLIVVRVGWDGGQDGLAVMHTIGRNPRYE